MTLSALLAQYREMGPVVEEQTLLRRGAAAWSLLKSQTRNRVLEVEEASQLGRQVYGCFAALVEAEEGEAVASETLGQWSRTYRGGSRQDRCLSILRQWLGETGLLYRGWDG